MSAIKFGVISAVLAMVICGLLGSIDSHHGKEPDIEIISYLVRDRAVPLDELVIRSFMIVGFKFSSRISPLPQDTQVQGELYFDDRMISRDKIFYPAPKGDNLEFQFSLFDGPVDKDRPFTIPEGRFRVVIHLVDKNNTVFAGIEKKIKSNQLSRRFDGLGKTYDRPRYVELSESIGNPDDLTADPVKGPWGSTEYVVFQKNYLDRVFPYTKPNPAEIVSSIHVAAARDEFRPITLSIKALKNLGRVQVKVSDCIGQQGVLPAGSIRVGTVGYLTETVNIKKKERTVDYRWGPKIIRSADAVIYEGSSQRYWLTLKIPTDVRPGEYKGTIIIIPESGSQTKIPLIVKVLPFCLTDTDIQYGMMMSYEFYELDNDIWSDDELALIRQNGLAICEDLRAHGMTMMYPHSYFYFRRDENGEPVLRSLEASLKAYADLKFPGPFCWYLGHLLQSAKVFHPGSILNYDGQTAEKRLRFLLDVYEKTASAFGIPKNKLIVQTVDEPDREDRIDAGKFLNRIAGDRGFKTLITRKWHDVDIICTLPPRSDGKAKQIREVGKQWWIYPNDALSTQNRAYVRYVFGFGAWRWDVDGVVPWTFQVTQGCNGNPFTVLDGSEVMVAYPGVHGPISTPTWETIREGINDYKYIYQLNKLIASEKARGNQKSVRIEQKLRLFKQNLGKAPAWGENDYGDWSPDSFAERRKQIVSWAIELLRGVETNQN
ncbi:hypothetical protein [Desulfobacula toluolica]|nr:hypothetical protein [Desulfobacula toluolica]